MLLFSIRLVPFLDVVLLGSVFFLFLFFTILFRESCLMTLLAHWVVSLQLYLSFFIHAYHNLGQVPIIFFLTLSVDFNSKSILMSGRITPNIACTTLLAIYMEKCHHCPVFIILKVYSFNGSSIVYPFPLKKNAGISQLQMASLI